MPPSLTPAQKRALAKKKKNAAVDPKTGLQLLPDYSTDPNQPTVSQPNKGKPKKDKPKPAPRSDMRSPDTRDAAAATKTKTEPPRKRGGSSRSKPRHDPRLDITLPPWMPQHPALGPPPKPPRPSQVLRRLGIPVAFSPKTGRYGELEGQVRIDPGGGLVAYGGKNAKEFNKAAAARAARERAWANEPRINAVSKEQIRNMKDDPLSKQELMDLAVDHWYESLDPDTLREAGFSKRKRWEVAIPYAPDIRDPVSFVEDVLPTLIGESAIEWSKGQRDFDKWTALDLALLAAMGAGTPASIFRVPAFGISAFGRTTLPGAGLAARIAGKEEGKLVARGTAKIIEKVGRGPNAVSKLIRNDPQTMRVFRLINPETGAVQTASVPAALSRTGKLMERSWDILRPVTSKVGVRTRGKGFTLAKSEAEKFAQALESETKFALAQAQMRMVQLQKTAGGSGMLLHLNSLSIPDHYALRMKGQGIDPELAVARHTELGLDALKRGDTFTALLHNFHARGFSSAAHLVDDKLAFTKDASKRLKETYSLLQKAGASREQILKDLDLITDETIKNRIGVIERMYRGAMYFEPEEWARIKMSANPKRQEIANVLATRYPDQPDIIDAFMANQDAMARHFGESQFYRQKGQLERLRKKVEARGGPTETEAALMAELEESIAKGIDPEAYYSHMFEARSGFPQEFQELFRVLRGSDKIDFDLDDGPALMIAEELLKRGAIQFPERLRDPVNLAKAIQNVAELATRGAQQDGRTWYARAAKGILQVTDMVNEMPPTEYLPNGVTPKQTAQLFAILSQADNTVNNVNQTLKFLAQYRQFGEGWAGRFPTRQSRELNAVMRGLEWEGRKRSSFYANIIEEIDPQEARSLGLVDKPVTVDRWVVRMFDSEMGDAPGKHYDAFEQAIQEISKQLGWEPKEVQAAAWVAKKQDALDAMGRNTILHKAGAGDAFEFGIEGRQAQLFEPQEVHPRALAAANMLKSKGGGFTLNRDLSVDDAQDGYYVAYGAYEHTIDAKQATGAEIERYRNQYDHILKRQKTAKVGGWHDPETGNVVLDISKWFKTKRAAMDFAKREGQTNVADVKAIRAKDWDNAFPETGLSHEEANAIKRGLRGSNERVAPLPFRENAPPKPLTPLQQADADIEAAIDAHIKAEGWPKTAESRKYADEQLWEESAEYRALRETRLKYYLEEDGIDFNMQRPPTPEGGWDARLHGSHIHSDLYWDDLPPGMSVVVLGESTLHPTATLAHEMIHYADWHGIFTRPQKDTLKRAFHDAVRRGEGWRYGEGEKGLNEFLAENYTRWLYEGGPSKAGLERIPSQYRQEMRDAFKKLKATMEKEYVAEDMRTLIEHGKVDWRPTNIPSEVRDVFDSIVAYKELTGPGQFRFKPGDEGQEALLQGRGELYLPEKAGLPVSIRRPWQTTRTYVQAFNNFAFRRGQAATLKANDPALSKHLKGLLLQSGRFQADVIEGTLESQMKASRIAAWADLRKKLLPLGTERPRNSDDIAVRVNLKKPVSISPTKTEMQLDLDLSRKLSKADVEKLGWREVEELNDQLFVGISQATEYSTEKVAADIISGVTDPVENVVWVPRKVMMDTGLFNPPTFNHTWKEGWGAVEWGVDAINDYMKAQLLLLHPAYYPMNIMGNLVMNFMQGGLMMPANLARAASIHAQLGTDAVLIDHFVGGGLASVATMKGAFLNKRIVNGMQEFANALVDRIPRRAAFIHEARRLGFKDAVDIQKLLTDPQYSEALRTAAQRAKWAMVDFDNMSRFERDVIGRVVFVYPWIKGATYWAGRFPKDHPIQSIAYAAAYTYQQDAAEEALPGGRPTYLDLFMPGYPEDSRVSELMPAEISRALGTVLPSEVERYGSTYPFGFNMRQLTTFATPYEIGLNIEKAITGDPSGQALTEMLQPFYGSVLTTLTGWDGFKHQEVPRSLGTFLAALNPENSPTWQEVGNVLRSDAERRADAEAGRLYPRNGTDDWLRLFLGSLAPMPINPDTSHLRSRYGPLSIQQRTEDWIRDAKLLTGKAPPSGFERLFSAKLEYSKILDAMHEETGKDRLDDAELTIARARAYAKMFPSKAHLLPTMEQAIRNADRDTLLRYSREFEEGMGWPQLAQYQALLDALEEKNRAQS